MDPTPLGPSDHGKEFLNKRIAHYLILEKLGEGGMGIVFKAKDTRLGRFLALKMLRPESVSDPARKQRFTQEAKSASALNHPNIIHIYDIGEQGGADFIAMEYVQGAALDRKILHLSGWATPAGAPVTASWTASSSPNPKPRGFAPAG